MPSLLFSPYALRGLTLANRIVVSPMAQYSGGPGNEATDWHVMHYGNLAVSGPGLVILEATAVEPHGRVGNHDIGLWTDAQQDSLARVLGFCRQHGQAAIGIQLAHSGRKASTARPWEGLAYLGEGEGGWLPVSGGDVPYPGRPVPRMFDHAGLAAGEGGFRRRDPPRRRDRLRPGRGARGAWLLPALLPLAAVEQPQRRLWRRPGRAHALPAGGLRRDARRLAGGEADGRAHLRHRLDAGRLDGGGLAWPSPVR